jgi:hypothetical protein
MVFSVTSKSSDTVSYKTKNASLAIHGSETNSNCKLEEMRCLFK